MVRGRSVTVSWTQNTVAQRSSSAAIAGQSFAVIRAKLPARVAPLSLGPNGSVDVTCTQAFGTADVVVDVVGDYE